MADVLHRCLKETHSLRLGHDIQSLPVSSILYIVKLVPEIVSRLCVLRLIFIFGIKQVLFTDLGWGFLSVNAMLLMKKKALSLEASCFRLKCKARFKVQQSTLHDPIYHHYSVRI